jgi:hypothetical protein
MLAEMVDHVVGIDPDRDWITAAVLEAGTTAVVATGRFPPTLSAIATWWRGPMSTRQTPNEPGRSRAPQVTGVAWPWRWHGAGSG